MSIPAAALLLPALVALFVPAGEKTVPPPPSEVQDEIVAIVNGEVITQRDVDEKVSQAPRETFGGTDEERRMQWQQTLLRLVIDKVKLQAAKKRDIAVQKDYVEDELERKRAGRSEAEFRDIVDQQGYTLDEYQQMLEETQLEKLFWYTQFFDTKGRQAKQRPSRSIEVRPDEVREAYNASKEKYRIPERARVSVISVKASKVGSRDAAKAIVEDLRAKIAAGADFAELARQHSSIARDEGGDLGWFGRDAGYLQPITEFAFSKEAAVGTLSDVLVCENVAIIVRKDGYEAERMRDFAEVSGQIKEQLHQDKLLSLYYDILATLIRESFIYPPPLRDQVIRLTEAQRK